MVDADYSELSGVTKSQLFKLILTPVTNVTAEHRTTLAGADGQYRYLTACLALLSLA